MQKDIVNMWWSLQIALPFFTVERENDLEPTRSFVRWTGSYVELVTARHLLFQYWKWGEPVEKLPFTMQKDVIWMKKESI